MSRGGVKMDETGLRLVDLEKKCKVCGGLLDVEPFPSHAAGCGCKRRSLVREQKALVEKIMRQGSVRADEAMLLSRGELPALKESKETPAAKPIHRNRQGR